MPGIDLNYLFARDKRISAAKIMVLKVSVILLISSISFGGALISLTEPAAAEERKRPRIGLVLGGGA